MFQLDNRMKFNIYDRFSTYRSMLDIFTVKEFLHLHSKYDSINIMQNIYFYCRESFNLHEQQSLNSRLYTLHIDNRETCKSVYGDFNMEVYINLKWYHIDYFTAATKAFSA